MRRETRPVRSREYKLMLRPRKFDGDKNDVLKSAEDFQNSLAKAVKEVAFVTQGEAVSGKFTLVAEEKQVTVEFFDTEDLRLRESGYVFRQRQRIGGGPLELTLKFRHPDRFLASDRKAGGQESKFEEDIKATHAHEFISLHSLSAKVKDVDAGTEFAILKNLRAFFKHLKEQLGDAYEASVKLHKVGNLTARQTVLEGVELQIGNGISAECALIVWHRKGGSNREPDVVEFSFRYKDKELGAKKEPFTAEMAQRCFATLQAFREKDVLAEWVDLKGPTKTAYVYSS